MGETRDKIEGSLKEKEGELSGDRTREKQGEAEKELGNAKGKLDEAKEKLKERL